MTGDNLYDEDRPAKPPKPQPPKPPAPPPPPMVAEAPALIERPQPPEELNEMNELTGLLPVWLRDREASARHGQEASTSAQPGLRAEPEAATPGFTPVNIPPPPDLYTQSLPPDLYSDTGGRGKRTTLGDVIRHCFGNYAQWREVQKSPE